MFMASRGSFQKRQKEAARKEKRQQKLDRRQGRAPIEQSLNHRSDTDEPQEGTEEINDLPEDSIATPNGTAEPTDRARAEAE
jgi:hypothetical protein